VTERPPDPGTLLDLPEGEGPDIAALIEEPLWRVRIRLWFRSFRRSWSQFAENKIGIFGLVIIVIFGIMALAHPILMSTVWNPVKYHPVSGYDAVIVTKTIVPNDEFTDPWTQLDFFTAKLLDPLVQVGDEVQGLLQPAPPSRTHLLGTDPLGRDVLSQLMFSTRAAFLLGIVAAIVTVFIATAVGAVSAFYGGWIDSGLMRLADFIIIIPFLPILIVLSAMWNFELIHLAILLGVLSGFGGTAVILKSQALSVTVKPFIDAARVAGGSNGHLIFRHVIPNVLPLSFLYMMFSVTAAIQIEATLSFLGLMNIDMSWGIMIFVANTQGYLTAGFRYWWLLIPSGAAVTLLAGAFFLVGRAMDEVVNPRLRKR
jgi:peptide/nickel transport system permease protein